MKLQTEAETLRQAGSQSEAVSWPEERETMVEGRNSQLRGGRKRAPKKKHCVFNVACHREEPARERNGCRARRAHSPREGQRASGAQWSQSKSAAAAVSSPNCWQQSTRDQKRRQGGQQSTVADSCASDSCVPPERGRKPKVLLLPASELSEKDTLDFRKSG